MRRQDSSTSMSTVNIGRNSGDGGGAFSFTGQSVGHAGDDVTDDISLSSASMTMGTGVTAADAASLADSASSMAIGQVGFGIDVVF